MGIIVYSYPYNGSLSAIAIVPGLKWINLATSEGTYMPDSNLYVAIEMDSLFNNHIYTIDIFTGNLRYPAPLVPPVYDIEYDSTTKNIYGIYYSTLPSYYFVDVNRYNGSRHVVSNLSPMDGISSYNASAFNSDSNQYIAENFGSSGDDIYTVKTSNGNILYLRALTKGVSSNLADFEYGHVSNFHPVISPNDSICNGSSVSLIASGGSNYSWSPALGLNSGNIPNPMASPTITTTYTVTISDAYCSSKKEITIEVKPSPSVNVCCDSSIIPGQSVQLITSGGQNFQWSPIIGLSCDTCPNPIATPTITTTYTVTVISDSGCISQRTVTIDVSCGNIFIPTAFSPNTKVNNILYVRGPCIASMDFCVFDRWGNKVFESQNPDIGWDGSYKGQPMNMGTYVWFLKATLQDGTTIEKNGNVALIK